MPATGHLGVRLRTTVHRLAGPDRRLTWVGVAKVSLAMAEGSEVTDAPRILAGAHARSHATPTGG